MLREIVTVLLKKTDKKNVSCHCILVSAHSHELVNSRHLAYMCKGNVSLWTCLSVDGLIKQELEE